MVSRREFIKALTAAGVTVSLAGCSDNSDNGNGSEQELDPPSMGDSSKPRVASFEDYACPHCRTFDLEIFPQIKEDFIDTGKIEYVHREFPIPVSDFSIPAAMGGRAVQDLEGDEAFWEYKKLIFENQGGLGYELIGQAASEVGADKEEVLNRTQDGVYRDLVDSDKAYAEELGVDSTPTLIYVESGEEIPSRPYSELSDYLETELLSSE